MQFIDLKAQYKHLEPRISQRIEQVLQHGGYILGPEVAELENQLAEYVGVKHAISCANGTDALQLSLLALNIGPGDAVFCPTFTFFASAEVIALSGATPCFVDSNPDTFNICPEDLEQRINQVKKKGELNVAAVIAVDLFGLPADYERLSTITDAHGMALIEDAAQGFGGTIKQKRAGGFGHIATTSFFPAKPLGCYGDGGAVFTNSDDYAKLIRSYRVHGKGQDKYDNIRIGLNSRLDTVQAAVLLEKLAVFPAELDSRNAAAARYSEKLAEHFNAPATPEGYGSSWAQYTLTHPDRDRFMGALSKQGIPSMVYYRTCMHDQTAFKDLAYQKGDFPVAERLAASVFSLPMHPYLEDNDIDRVTSILLAQ